ncbi:hypothetical protein B7494_g5082 [Chlorociboria aeruginascens]|nr:hypothetical protein B7494_g5082 [Chlorociboria aeruginascens]
MILGIFFARFLPQEGTKVVYQSPPNCIVSTSPNALKPPLFDFDTISEYIIPRQAFFNRLVSILDPDSKYRILGHPICITDPKYARNEFMFNFSIVLRADIDEIPYEAVVRRLASTFAELEVQNGFLSGVGGDENADESKERCRSIEALIEIVKEDLNNFNECMIPVDNANTINMKLFPYHAPPPPVKPWNVPISKIAFSAITDSTWDLSMLKILPQIDGIKDVRSIAHSADVSLPLTKIALQHLLYYDSILLIDLFLFSNIYAPTMLIRSFINNEDDMQEECANYVFIHGHRLPNYYLCRLFTSLCTSRSVKEWLKLHSDQGFPVLEFIDVRRFIQFGVIKGILYRIHKFAVGSRYLASLGTAVVDRTQPTKNFNDRHPPREISKSGIKIGINRLNNNEATWDPEPEEQHTLQKYTDGCHSFDQIITELNMGDARIMDLLRQFPEGDVKILYR